MLVVGLLCFGLALGYGHAWALIGLAIAVIAATTKATITWLASLT